MSDRFDELMKLARSCMELIDSINEIDDERWRDGWFTTQLTRFELFLKEMGDGTDIRAMQEADVKDCRIWFSLMEYRLQTIMKELRGSGAPLGELEYLHTKRDG